VIAEFLYRNPRILILAIAVIGVAGLTSLFLIPRLEDPVLRQRVGLISTAYPGGDAQQVETLVTIPIEQQLASIPEIKQVRSNSRTGISNIVIELKDEVNDVDPVWSLVRTRLADAQAKIPTSCLPSGLEVLPLKAFAAVVAVKWKDPGEPNYVILRRLTNHLRAEISEIPGTESIETFGDPGEQYVAEITPSTLAALGMSIGAIAQQVSESNTTLPSGRLQGSNDSLLLDLKSNPLPIQRVAQALVAYGDRGDSVELSEIATIRKRVVEPPPSLALIDGQPAIVIGAFVSDDQQVDQWSGQLDNVIANFEKQYPAEIIVDLIFSQRQHVDQRMFTLLKNLVLGTAAVVLIVLLLMGWRSMLVVAATLPLSALMVVTGMRLFSIPIHQMSVTGLIVALGLLIDNAIVIVEDVRSRIVRGEAPSQAIVGGVRHLAMPLFGSTLTTALAFLPIATLSGPSGEFVGTIAMSVILAIGASFTLAMTITPAMTGLLNIDPSQRGLFHYGLTLPPIQRIYESSLRFVFRFPLLGVALGLVLPVCGFLVAKGLPQQFFPPSDRKQIQIEVERPARDTLTGTRNSVDEIFEIVGKNPNVRRQFWFLGESAPTFFYNVVPRRRGTPFYAQAFIDLNDSRGIAEVVRNLQSAIDEQVFDSRVIVRQLEQGPPFDAPLEVRLVGSDLGVLQSLGSQLRLLLSQTADVIHTRSDLEETIPKLTLALNRKMAKSVGLSESQIAAQLYTLLEGAPAGKIYDGGEEFTILIKTAFEPGSKMDQLAAIPLTSQNRLPPFPGSPPTQHASHPTLASLTEFDLDADVGGIVRIDGRRVNEVKAYIEAGVLPSIVMENFKTRLSASNFVLPAGYSLEFGGETEQRSNAVRSLIANAIVLFALMLLTLVTSFRSFRCALIIALVGGLSVGLGPLALSVFGYPFGFMAIVGTMGLVGVAINDSIVVLAAIRESEPSCEGNVHELSNVVSGCSRHVIATTLTTIVGFLPLILGGGGFWPPLAITIAGGVGGATFLALYFVPSLHLLLFARTKARQRQENTIVAAQIPPDAG
jgi:multidrug efflux pump subunit AcrB